MKTSDCILSEMGATGGKWLESVDPVLCCRDPPSVNACCQGVVLAKW